ncbi:hypothetical protein [Candidatus Neptunichlamydia sp. REUL1]|uniref:hypothetical protein n=1 Tax=Candidatus Neptunichlamydia sp. REUL1 TaxID=3064277 RepID=UPI00292D4E29|nr:hypothetical protein [Candidatus Neptunochlamydia sp. REUL1]
MKSINFKLIGSECASSQAAADYRTNASPGKPPYLKSTESGHAESLEEMRAIPAKDNGVYLGSVPKDSILFNNYLN